MGGNTPTPHKFGGILNTHISEFDPMSGRKPSQLDNYL